MDALVVNKKRLFLVSFLILAVLFVVLVFPSFKEKKKIPEERPKPLGDISQELKIVPPSSETGETASGSFNLGNALLKFNSFPRELAVYKSSQSEFDIKAWAASLGFSGEGVPDGDYLTFEKGVAFLRFDPRRNYLEYYQDYGLKALTAASKDLEGARRAAREFLLRSGLYQGLEGIKEKEVRYYAVDGSEISQVKDPLKSDFVEFRFEKTLGGFPLVGGGRVAEPTTVSLDFNGRVTALTQTVFSLKGKKEGLYLTKDLAQVSREVNEGKLRLADFSSSKGDAAPAKFRRVEMEDVEIAYLIPGPGEEIFKPIFIFSGSGYNNEGSPFKAKFYLVAVK